MTDIDWLQEKANAADRKTQVNFHDGGFMSFGGEAPEPEPPEPEGPRTPAPDPSQGVNGGPAPVKEDMDEFLRENLLYRSRY